MGQTNRKVVVEMGSSLLNVDLEIIAIVWSNWNANSSKIDLWLFDDKLKIYDYNCLRKFQLIKAWHPWILAMVRLGKTLF